MLHIVEKMARNRNDQPEAWLGEIGAPGDMLVATTPTGIGGSVGPSGWGRIQIMKLRLWAQLAEIIASFAVVVTLVFLLLEVRTNTTLIERQINIERSASLTAPFFEGSGLVRAFAKVKAIDGHDPLLQAFTERYDLTVEESTLWERHLYTIWDGLEADFLYSGPSGRMDRYVEDLLSYPDGQMFWEHMNKWYTGDFGSYVESIRAAP